MSEQYDYLHARMSRRTVLMGAAIGGLGAASPALWVQSAGASADSPVASRHLSFGADPRHQAVVSFAADHPFRSALVEYGLDDSFGKRVAVDVRAVPGVRTLYGHARLDGLEAGRAYRYRERRPCHLEESRRRGIRGEGRLRPE